MVNTGMFNATFNPAELNTRSFNGTILRKFPGGAAPLFALSSQTGKSRAVSSTHGYFTKTFAFTIMTTHGVLIAAATTAITVLSTAGMVADMLFYVPGTREVLRIVSITSATVFESIRGVGRIAAADIPLSTVITCIGTALPEGSDRPTARSIPTVYVPNFTQIFRNAWAVTDTARASLVEAGEGNVAESKRDGMLFHATDIELAMFLGQAKMDTTGAQPRHSTQGVIDAIYEHAPGNVQTLGATTTLSQLETALLPGFAFNTDLGNAGERVGFCDSTALQVLNQIGRLNGQIQLISETTTFGLRFSTFKFFKGIIRLIEHPMFSGLAAFGGTMVTIDLPAIKLAYMEGRDALREEYGPTGKQTANGTDAVGGTLTSELAVETINPSACQVITGFTAGAAG